MTDTSKFIRSNLDNCPVCNSISKFEPARYGDKVIICCTNKSCFLHAGTMATWDSEMEAATAWNKKWGGYMKTYDDLPKWLQELWNIDCSLARKAEQYIKTIKKK